jgi:ribosomal protein S28E/S33
MKKSHILAVAITAFSVLWFGVVFFRYSGVSFIYVASYFQKADSYQHSNILFYGEGCDHCATVDTFIERNGVDEKISFVRLEVFHNKAHENILSRRAEGCGLPVKEIGVPFFWEANTQRCVLGDADIIAFLRGKISAKKP